MTAYEELTKLLQEDDECHPGITCAQEMQEEICRLTEWKSRSIQRAQKMQHHDHMKRLDCLRD
jgi:hypothetical protein